MKSPIFLLLITFFISIVGCTQSTDPDELTAFRNLTGMWELYTVEDGELVYKNYMVGPDLTINANTPSEISITGSFFDGTKLKAIYSADTVTISSTRSNSFVKNIFILVEKNKFHWYQELHTANKDRLVARYFFEGRRVQ